MDFKPIEELWQSQEEDRLDQEEEEIIMEKLEKISRSTTRGRIGKLIGCFVILFGGGPLCIYIISSVPLAVGWVAYAIGLYALVVVVTTLGAMIKQIRREKQFGRSIKEETEQRFYQVKHQILDARCGFRWILIPGFILWTISNIWISYYIEYIAIKHIPFWVPAYVLFGCVYFFGVGWLLKQVIKKLEPQQQWLEHMLSMIDNEPEQV